MPSIRFEPLRFAYLGWCDACCPDQTKKVVVQWKCIYAKRKVLLLCNECYNYIKKYQDQIEAGEVELYTLLSRRLNRRKKEEEEMKERIRFSDIQKSTLNSEGQLTDLVDQTIIIKGVEFQYFKGFEQDVAIVIYSLEGNENETHRRHTFSKPMIDQLKTIEPYLKEGKEVIATITKVKRYYVFQ